MGMMSFKLALVLIISGVAYCNGGTSSSYVRKTQASTDLPLSVLSSPPGYNAPEQVHITQGDHNGRGMIVSWVTPLEKSSNFVEYWKVDDDKNKQRAYSDSKEYSFCNYKSGHIHHATIKNLEYNTKYVYEVGNANTTRRFSFTTPPEVGPDVPYTFGIIGDLGQTYDSNQTLEHYNSNPKGQTVLYVGDLSYADNYPLHDNRRWDSWGRFVEKNAAYQPWIWTAGNHELDYLPDYGETVPFKPFTHRYHVPYKASNSTSPLWYSIKRASAYIIVLSSYSAYGESMRVMFEPWFVENKVDIVFSGHVHAYERSERISNIAYKVSNGNCTPVLNSSAPVYITIGDGGNIEGLANKFTEPQPSYSAYREASFGHAMLEIKNRTHAFYSWHRNQDSEAVLGDSQWFYNRQWYPHEESSTAGTVA
ncbi:hypothetical protein IFM89_037656 [Coptis chinensis]|uniref:Purple acid phosphatase n=1 Tax=Coptis chinensis TaxID=261450 RepID=A0A835M8F3_9MAGN|nr:hypothetical protein IFM89_037656 [Coptis chinensis]